MIDHGSYNELTTNDQCLPCPVVSDELVRGFYEWLIDRKGVSEDTASYYVNVVNHGSRTGGWPPVKRAHRKAWRNYVRYLFSIGRLNWERLQGYLAYLELGKYRRGATIVAKVDTSLIKTYILRLEQERYSRLYLLLLGGARLSHVMHLLLHYTPDEEVKHPTGAYAPRLYCSRLWCRYYLGIRHGRKRIDYIYWVGNEHDLNETRFNIIVRHEILSYKMLKLALHKIGVKAKIFRKYVNQVLETLAQKHNIRLDAVNLIMSRELSVTGAHYLDTLNWSDKLFTIYVEYLKTIGLARRRT